MKAKPRARRRPAIAPRPMAPVSARPSSAIAPPPMSDAELADQIKSTIRKIGPGGRFGWKVFISEIWRRMMPDLTREGMTLSAFKQRLLRLNREGRIVLARADLVGAMDPTKVAESEIQDRGSTFHFVLDPESTPGY
jgi:hypothetical protein